MADRIRRRKVPQGDILATLGREECDDDEEESLETPPKSFRTNTRDSVSPLASPDAAASDEEEDTDGSEEEEEEEEESSDEEETSDDEEEEESTHDESPVARRLEALCLDQVFSEEEDDDDVLEEEEVVDSDDEYSLEEDDAESEDEIDSDYEEDELAMKVTGQLKEEPKKPGRKPSFNGVSTSTKKIPKSLRRPKKQTKETASSNESGSAGSPTPPRRSPSPQRRESSVINDSDLVVAVILSDDEDCDEADVVAAIVDESLEDSSSCDGKRFDLLGEAEDDTAKLSSRDDDSQGNDNEPMDGLPDNESVNGSRSHSNDSLVASPELDASRAVALADGLLDHPTLEYADKDSSNGGGGDDTRGNEPDSATPEECQGAVLDQQCQLPNSSVRNAAVVAATQNDESIDGSLNGSTSEEQALDPSSPETDVDNAPVSSDGIEPSPGACDDDGDYPFAIANSFIPQPVMRETALFKAPLAEGVDESITSGVLSDVACQPSVAVSFEDSFHDTTDNKSGSLLSRESEQLTEREQKMAVVIVDATSEGRKDGAPSVEAKENRRASEQNTADNVASMEKWLRQSRRPGCQVRVKRGRWTRGSKIGSGAFGVVYVGMNTLTGTLMAIKSVKMDVAVMKDVRREIDMLRTLQHKNIVRYYGAELTNGDLHIFQEWVAGGSVTAMLSRFGPFSIPVIRSYLSQLLEGLVYLHENGIMHRDIKGSNILVTDSGIVKLADFGASKKLQSDMMLSHTMKGTPYFMAPEVFEEKYSFAADIWSVGCVVFQMFTGLPPWKTLGITNPVALFNYLKGSDGPPSIQIPTSSFAAATEVVSLKSLVSLCFQRTPSCRPSAKELLEDSFLIESAYYSDDEHTASPGMHSPLSTFSAEHMSPIRTRASPIRGLARSNSISGPASPFLSPPLPKRPLGHSTSSPLTYSPSPDTKDWPNWARNQKQDNMGSPVTRTLPTMDSEEDSLVYSPSSASGTSGRCSLSSVLLGMNLLEQS